MGFPVEQLIIGLFAIATAIVTGIFSVYTAKVSKKLNRVEKKTEDNHNLSIENNILEQIVPVLEKKDEALDKMAEVLDNLLRTQALTNQQLKSISIILEQRCQAVELAKIIKGVLVAQKQYNDSIKIPESTTNIAELLDTIVENYESKKDDSAEGGDAKTS